MVIGVEGDATTPTDHAERLYEAARGPKTLLMQRHTTHYAAYDRYWDAGHAAHGRVVRRLRAPERRRQHAPRPTPAGVETIELLEDSRMSIDLRIAGGTVVTPSGPVAADVLVDGEQIAGLVIAERRASDVDARHRRDRQARAARHDRRPRAHPRARLHAQGGHLHDDRSRPPPAASPRCSGCRTSSRRPTTRRRSKRSSTLYREKSIVDCNHNPAATDPRRDPGDGRHGRERLQDLHGRRHRPHLPAPGGHRHARPRRPAADDGHHRQDRQAVHHPPARPVADGLHRGRVLDRGENTPQGYADGVRRARRRHLGHRDRGRAAARRGVRLPRAPRPHADRAGRSRRSGGPRRNGVDVTCEVNHWAPFLSTWDDVERLGPYALSYWVPDDARAAVWEALRDGTIDMFSSDHAPHTREEKEIGWTQMWSAHTGTPGIQYFYPLALDAVREGKLSLAARGRPDGHQPGAGTSAWPDQGRARAGPGRRHRHRRPRRALDHHQRRRAVEGRLDLLRRPRRAAPRSSATFVRGHEVFADGDVVGDPRTRPPRRPPDQGAHRP